MTPRDRDALRRCYDEMIKDSERAEQFARKVEQGSTWDECAMLASHILQGRSLNLKAWDWPPCAIVDGVEFPATWAWPATLRWRWPSA
jgi:hypothetical protein